MFGLKAAKPDPTFLEIPWVPAFSKPDLVCIFTKNSYYRLYIIYYNFRTKHRKSYVVPACLSTEKETMYVTFAAQGHVGHIAKSDEQKNSLAANSQKETQETFVNVTCLPLFSILMALDNPRIDYFSLDVEGSELAILKTIPFDKVNIMVNIIYIIF